MDFARSGRVAVLRHPRAGRLARRQQRAPLGLTPPGELPRILQDHLDAAALAGAFALPVVGYMAGSYALTGGNEQTANPIRRSSLRGDDVVTTDMLPGQEPVHLRGATDT